MVNAEDNENHDRLRRPNALGPTVSVVGGEEQMQGGLGRQGFGDLQRPRERQAVFRPANDVQRRWLTCSRATTRSRTTRTSTARSTVGPATTRSMASAPSMPVNAGLVMILSPSSGGFGIDGLNVPHGGLDDDMFIS